MSKYRAVRPAGRIYWYIERKILFFSYILDDEDLFNTKEIAEAQIAKLIVEGADRGEYGEWRP